MDEGSRLFWYPLPCCRASVSIVCPPRSPQTAPAGAAATRTNPTPATYGENILEVRVRAHLDVAQRHQADLLSNAR